MNTAKKIIKHFFHFISKFGTKEKKQLAGFDYKTLARFLHYQNLFNGIGALDGDIVECGVGRGSSFLALSILSKMENKNRAIWGFDSFEGFPASSEKDTGRKIARGYLAGNSLGGVLDLLARAGLGKDFIDTKINLVKGLFDDTLPKYSGKIALLHIDADLYDSYSSALKNLYPKVVRGGIIMFDEYAAEKDIAKWPGAKRAIDEFFGEKKRTIRKGELVDKYYIIKEE